MFGGRFEALEGSRIGTKPSLSAAWTVCDRAALGLRPLRSRRRRAGRLLLTWQWTSLAESTGEPVLAQQPLAPARRGLALGRRSAGPLRGDGRTNAIARESRGFRASRAGGWRDVPPERGAGAHPAHRRWPQLAWRALEGDVQLGPWRSFHAGTTVRCLRARCLCVDCLRRI